MAVSYGVLDEATVRSALNRLEAVCSTQDAKLEFLNAVYFKIQSRLQPLRPLLHEEQAGKSSL